MFRAALVTLVTALAGGYAQAEDAAVEDTPAVDETPAVTKVKCLKPKYTSVMTVSGYTGESELENFPVAVRISTANIPGFDYAKCDGEGDVTFTDNDGNILPHEIEVWNTEGESVAWVSIPKLSTVVAEDKTTYTTFKMHWGHETKLADTKATEVWSGANYLGVWHMNSSGTQQDSSGNNRNMSVTSTFDTGIITNGMSKIGCSFYSKQENASQGVYSALQTPAVAQGIEKNFTVSGWTSIGLSTNDKHEESCDATNTGAILFRSSELGSYHWRLYGYSTWGALRLRYKSTDSGIGKTFNVRAAGWFHYAVVITGGSSFTVYINGELCGTKTGLSNYTKYKANFYEWGLLGKIGRVDECRMRTVGTNGDWIKAEYDSINNKQFVVASEAVKNGYGLKIIVR